MHPSRFLLLFACAGALRLAAAASSTHSYAERTALAYVTSHPTDAELDGVLTQAGVGAGQRRNDITALVQAMRRELAAGVQPGSEAFWAGVDSEALELVPAPPRGAVATVVRAVGGGLDNDQLYALGRNALLGKTSLERTSWLHFNGAPYASGRSGDWSSDPTARLALTRYGAKLAQQQPAADATLVQAAQQLNSSKSATRLAQGTGGDKAAVAETADMLEPTPDLNEPVVEPPAVNNVFFRDAGISFAAGYGIVRRRGDDAAIGSFIARWNLWQRIASAKWNRWIGTDNPDGYHLVPFRGIVEYYSNDRRAKGESRFSRVPQPRVDNVLGGLQLTHLGPFIGTAAVGERVHYQRADGTEFQERPWLIGGSVGFGFLNDAAPAFTIDVGSTISPSRGFDGRDLYLGVSLDAALFQKLLNLRLTGNPDKSQ